MCRQIKSNELKNYKLKLALFVLLVGLRRHPQGQHVHTTALSEKWSYCLLVRDRNTGPIPMATGVGVMSAPVGDVLGQKALLLSMSPTVRLQCVYTYP